MAQRKRFKLDVPFWTVWHVSQDVYNPTDPLNTAVRPRGELERIAMRRDFV